MSNTSNGLPSSVKTAGNRRGAATELLVVRSMLLLGLANVLIAPALAQTDRPERRAATDAANRRGVQTGWKRFRGPQGNGICSEKLNLLETPERIWRADVGRGNASLIVDKGRLYTIGHMNGSSKLNCLNADTGETVWEQPLRSHHFDSSPVLVDGKLFLLCDHGGPEAYCLEAETGDVVWEQRDLPKPPEPRHYGHAGSPLLWKELVFLNAGTGTAVMHDTGQVVWQHAGLAGLATPVMFEHQQRPAVLIFGGKALYARDARTGDELWSIPWDTNLAVNACDPIYHDGKVFISTTYGKRATCFDVREGRPRVLWKEDGSSFSSGFLWKGHLYCFTGGNFSCLDFDTGRRKWTGPGVGGGSAILADDKLVLLSDQGRLLIGELSPQRQFRPEVQAQVLGGTTWTPPSLVDGKLYVRHKEGGVACVRIGR